MRKGDWIQTYTGKKFYPLDPRPEDIDLMDIAHSLSMLCRYNGHSREFYSVAQHSVLMSMITGFGDPRWLLLHDAAEAYVCDIPRPIKPMLAEYKGIEDGILKVIGERFGLGEPDADAIKQADLIMLATEKRDVVEDGPDWEINLPVPLEKAIHPWPWWRTGRDLFLHSAKELSIDSGR